MIQEPEETTTTKTDSSQQPQKIKSLKKKSFAEIQELFDKAMKRTITFVDFRTELVEESTKKDEAEKTQESSSKREGDELDQERSKKHIYVVSSLMDTACRMSKQGWLELVCFLALRLCVWYNYKAWTSWLGMESRKLGDVGADSGIPNDREDNIHGIIKLRKSVNFLTLLAPTGNGADVAISLESVRAISKVLLILCMVSFWKNGWLSPLLITMSSYAIAMIELRADVELEDTIVVVMPKLIGEGFYLCAIRVEYK
nr:hypothetical protein [Tanacetum cinerariifolium]